MKKIYYLKNCSTCQKIISMLGSKLNDFEFKNIKTDTLNSDDLEEMRKLSLNYGSLFSRRSQLYKKQGLKERVLSENDYRDLILSHYTFLKRPVIIDEKTIFIGSDKSNIERIKSFFKV